MVWFGRSTTAHTTVAHSAAGMVSREPIERRDHLGGTVTVGEKRTAHVAQRSHRRGGFEAVTDAITDDEATASFAEVEDVVPVAADGEVARFGQVPCGHSR